MIKISLKGVGAEFDTKDKELTYAVNSLARAQAFESVNKLKAATPIDTGRARNSWTLTKNKNEFEDAKGGYNLGGSFLGPIPNNRVETLYATNGTPYIEDLNRGSSKQAPARFIEKTILQNYTPAGVLFETINNKD